MGSARVQYELERTLPSLQLATTHGLFSKDTELRGITQRRRQFENALVRRKALARDFVQYIRYEEDLEKLRNLRVDRLKDVNKIPRQDLLKLQKEAISHIISIFERGVKRLRYDLDLWEYYIRWAHSKKMRVVVSRVSARALSLFPNKVDLWLLVADLELNDFQSASTSRALLQRGLRLNSISHSRNIQAQTQERPRKRLKKDAVLEEKSTSTRSFDIEPADNSEDNKTTLTLNMAEQDLVRIWVQYIRMELVFLERLRRRRLVLGISDDIVEEDVADDEIQQKITEEDVSGQDVVPVHVEGEEAPVSLGDLSKVGEVHGDLNGFMQGAIAKAALRSAISLHSPNSIPPRAHFALLTSVLQLVRGFPFFDDTVGLKRGLVSYINEILQARFPTDVGAMLLLSASSLLDEKQTSELALVPEVEMKEELANGALLKKVCRLSNEEQNIDQVFIAPSHTKDESEWSTGHTFVLQLVQKSLEQSQRATELASHTRNVLDTMRRKCLNLSQPTGLHFAFQLHLIRIIEDIVKRRGLEDVLSNFLDLYSKQVVRDAKHTSNSDATLEREIGRGRLEQIRKFGNRTEVPSTKVLKLEGTMWTACSEQREDKALLILYSEACIFLATKNVLSKEDVLKRWLRIHSHPAGKDSAELWSSWCDWILANEKADVGKMHLHEGIIKTLTYTAAHQAVLQGYLKSASSSSDLLTRISHIEKRASPVPSLWRWTIKIVRQNKWIISEQHTAISHLFTILTRSNDEVGDQTDYLRFLMLDAGDSTAALELFRKVQTKYRQNPAKKSILEQCWEEICQHTSRIEEGQDGSDDEANALDSDEDDASETTP